MLSGEQVQRRGIVAPGLDLPADSVQPNGIDLSLDVLWRLSDVGALGAASADRSLPSREPVQFDEDGWASLEAGVYGLRFVERVSLPTDCGALAFPRSSLLRMGAHVPTAVWDAGYDGRAESFLQVSNPHGLRIQRGARIAQLVVFALGERTSGYGGRYQGENL